MSQRGAELLKDDLAVLGPVRIKDVDAAQQTIIQRSAGDGEGRPLSLKGSPSDQYVN